MQAANGCSLAGYCAVRFMCVNKYAYLQAIPLKDLPVFHEPSMTRVSGLCLAGAEQMKSPCSCLQVRLRYLLVWENAL